MLYPRLTSSKTLLYSSFVWFFQTVLCGAKHGQIKKTRENLRALQGAHLARARRSRHTLPVRVRPLPCQCPRACMRCKTMHGARSLPELAHRYKKGVRFHFSISLVQTITESTSLFSHNSGTPPGTILFAPWIFFLKILENFLIITYNK